MEILSLHIKEKRGGEPEEETRHLKLDREEVKLSKNYGLKNISINQVMNFFEKNLIFFRKIPNICWIY